MLYTVLLALPILLRIPFASAAGFVEEVACSSAGLTVMLNRSDPALMALMNDPKASAQPVVYVYGHKARVQCGTMLRNEKGAVNYNLTIAYGKACDVHVTDLEPAYRISEMAIVLENNLLPKKQILNQVSCVYSTKVQATRYSDVQNTPPISEISHGRPKPKVDMLFRSIDGTSLREARVGETLEFYLSLQPDNAYKAILPKECVFSDREDMQSPETQRITFVQGSCPVKSVEEIIDPLAHVNQEVFFSKFKTFRFRDQPTVFVHCTAQVCLTKEECATKCFEQIQGSNLTAQRLRFRHKRDASGSIPAATDIHNFHAKLQIYTPEEEKEILHRVAPQLGLSSSSLYLFSALLLAVSVASIIVIVYLLYRLNRRNKESTFDLYSAAQLRSMANSSASLVDRYPAPLHVNTAFHSTAFH